MRSMGKLFWTVIWMLLLVFPVHAQSGPQAVERLLKDKISRVIDILEQQDLPEAAKRSRIEAVVDPVFNYELMAKLSLGPKNWPRLSAAQQEIFIKRFVRRLKDSYFDKISMYSGDSEAAFEYLPARQAGGKVHVPVKVSTKDTDIEILYKFYRAGKDWVIYDVEINGVSIIQSYRAQFAQILSEGTVADLLDELGRKQGAE